MPWQCFMLQETNTCARYLRRFTFGGRPDGVDLNPGPDHEICPAGSEYEGYKQGHEASVRIENGRIKWTKWETTPAGRKRHYMANQDESVPHKDPRWPKTCKNCGQKFKAKHVWQVFTHHLYKTPDGKLVTIHPNPQSPELTCPPGAMLWVDWVPDDWCGPEGKGSLSVMTPGGIWHIDAPATGGGRWTRTGEPPNVTATPSILIGTAYHGFLTGGVLTDPI